MEPVRWALTHDECVRGELRPVIISLWGRWQLPGRWELLGIAGVGIAGAVGIAGLEQPVICSGSLVFHSINNRLSVTCLPQYQQSSVSHLSSTVSTVVCQSISWQIVREQHQSHGIADSAKLALRTSWL